MLTTNLIINFDLQLQLFHVKQ